MFLVGRSLVLIAVLAALVLAGTLYGARHLHNEFEGFLEARLQSDLIANNADYRRALIEVEDISIIFVGDIMLSRGVEMMIARYNDYKYPFLFAADKLSGADIAFGNLEGPISSRGTNQGSEYSFRAKPEVVDGLSFAGFDVLSVANNHIYDWGAQAIYDTTSILKRNSIESVGAGSSFDEANAPVIIERAGAKVGFLAYTTLYPESLEARGDGPGVSDIDSAKDAVENLSREVDVLVVSMHWGDEYATESNASQRELGRALIDAGADLVIGHHPHVVEEIEEYGGGWIVYSLGNFVFDQGFSEETKTGLAIEAGVSGRKITSIDKIDVRMSETFQPKFVNP